MPSFQSRRVHLLLPLLAALAADCATAPAPAPPAPAGPSAPSPAAPPPAPNVAAVTDEMIARTNAARRAAGVPALARSAALMSAAQLQADQMVKAGRMDHELPGQPYPDLKSRLTAVRYDVRAAGENIAEGQRSGAEAVTTWMNSPAHRDNILARSYTEMGAGVAAASNGRRYFVQVFGRPAAPAARTTPPA